MAGAFLFYGLIVADWVELMCKLYLVCFHGVKWFGGLTRVFAWEIDEKEKRAFGRAEAGGDDEGLRWGTKGTRVATLPLKMRGFFAALRMTT